MNLATKCTENASSDYSNFAKTMITQTCVLRNGVDLYPNQGERLILDLVRPSSILCLKEDDKIACFDITWLGLLQRCSWSLWK